MAESFHKQNLLSLIGGYATPLAVGLVGTGLIMAPLEPAPLYIGTSLMLFSLVFNVAAIPLASRMSDRSRSIFAKVRATLNLWINIILVVLLGRVWPPVWLLFMLPAVATAVYGDRKRTLVTVGFLSAVLWLVNLFTGPHTPMEWGVVAAEAAFLSLTSLMINDLVSASSPSK
jgi:hypothetical protein